MDEVAGIFFFLFVVFLIFGLPVIFIVVGRSRERASLEDIARRENLHRQFPVVDVSFVPSGIVPVRGQLVHGQVVIASDYLKNLFAQYRQIFGGEMKSYQTMMQRAKAEARLRMIEEARKLGAVAVVNVRVETSQIGSSGRKAAAMSEVLCYGTAVFES